MFILKNSHNLKQNEGQSACAGGIDVMRTTPSPRSVLALCCFWNSSGGRLIAMANLLSRMIVEFFFSLSRPPALPAAPQRSVVVAARVSRRLGCFRRCRLRRAGTNVSSSSIFFRSSETVRQATCDSSPLIDQWLSLASPARCGMAKPPAPWHQVSDSVTTDSARVGSGQVSGLAASVSVTESEDQSWNWCWGAWDITRRLRLGRFPSPSGNTKGSTASARNTWLSFESDVTGVAASGRHSQSVTDMPV